MAKKPSAAAKKAKTSPPATNPVVYHLEASRDPRHVYHHVLDSGACSLIAENTGTDNSQYALNLASGHPYVIKHYRTLGKRCVLEIQQLPRETIDRTGAGKEPQRTEPRGPAGPCYCEDGTLVSEFCLRGQVPVCPPNQDPFCQ